jgi:hypothetical protein
MQVYLAKQTRELTCFVFCFLRFLIFSTSVVPAGAGARIEFHATTSKGAILYLPEGAFRTNLLHLEKLRNQALKHTRDWYRFVNSSTTLGRRAPNGSLYLITGCDKGPSWGVASFSNRQGGRGLTIQLMAQVAEANASYSHAGETTSGVNTRYGPYPPNHDRGINNQAVFIRGFRLSLRDGLSAMLKGPHKVRLEDNLEKTHSVPFAGGSKSWRTWVPFFNGGGSRSLCGDSGRSSRSAGQTSNRVEHTGRNQAISQPSEETAPLNITSDGDVHLELVPGDSEASIIAKVPQTSANPLSQLFHPSTAINQFLLDSNPVRVS